MKYGKILKNAALISTIAMISACGPRGESKSLDEVLSLNRSRYLESSTAEVPADLKGALGKVTTGLDQIAGLSGGGKADGTIKDVSQNLASLVDKAGYTQRAAMAELISQYRELGAANTPLDNGAPQLKLLAARTYRLLASEMTSTKFRL